MVEASKAFSDSRCLLAEMKGPAAELTKLLGDGLDAKEILSG